MTKQPGRRHTRQRQVIVEELAKLDYHPTAAELYEQVRQRLPRISLGTVYRNLEVLSEMGLVRKVESAGSGARFDCNPDTRHHVRCVECGKVWDLTDVPEGLPGGELNNVDGYEILDYHVEYRGYCPNCRKRKEQGGDSSLHFGRS